MMDDEIVFCSPIHLQIDTIKKSVEEIFSCVTMFNKLDIESKIYACVDGNADLERQVGLWQGLLADHNAYVIPVDTRSWYHAIVSPYRQSNGKENPVLAVIDVAKNLAPDYQENFEYLGFAESFHLARYSRMVALELSRTFNRFEALEHRTH